ncbi:MAG: hypothetical protein M3Z36_07845 [Acidobacteriota bacterium]|nr:hypothetical protein [Acidobacteriota bacterium]
MEKPFVFVIMPFESKFADAYNLGIKPACEVAGAICERVDEQTFVANILQRIYDEITRADVVVADMTGRNPNVFYEAGFAHGVGKQVILLTQKGDEIPFDLKHYPFVIYESITMLKSELEKKVRWCLNHPNEGAIRSPAQQEFARMSKHIMNYFEAHREFKMISFDRIRENINGKYTDEKLSALIDQMPEHFRRTKMEGNRPGIGLVSR